MKRLLYVMLLGFFKANGRVGTLFYRQTAYLKDRYGLQLDFSRLRVRGINRLRVEGLQLAYKGMTPVSVGSVTFRLSWWGLLKRRKGAADAGGEALGPGSEQLMRLVRVYRRLSPWLFRTSWQMEVRELAWQSERLSFTVSADAAGRQMQLRSIAGIESGRGLRAGLAEIGITERKEEGGLFFALKGRMEDVELHHRYIGGTRCHLRHIGLDLVAGLKKDWAGFGDQSSLSIDGCPIAFRVFAMRELWPVVGSLWVIELEKETIARLLPHFRHRLLKAEKDVKFTIVIIFRLDLKDPERQHIDIVLKKEGFSTEDVLLDLAYLRGPFRHTISAADGSECCLDFAAEETEHYIPIEETTPLLQRLIVLSEDPNFYRHAGVDKYFIGRAIAANFRGRRVLRGASTITMQLCKNLFLTPETSVLRKLEEMSMSLLMENVFGIPKARILEIYLNLIELAPGIYGIKDGSRYYFSKHPNELTLTELIVLTYVIPRPVHFYDALIRRSQQLMTNLSNYIDQTLRKLVRYKILDAGGEAGLDRRIVFSDPFGVLDLGIESYETTA